MASSLSKVTPFIVVNKTAELYGTSDYPLGGTNPPVSGTVSAPSPPGGLAGPLPGTNCINLLTLRDYYKIPYPPTTPLASPPVIAIISFGGGIYGQPVSSGKYSGFWKCTDISGANGAPIQILVSPLNGAINAPNADDGGATLENTVDVATISAFYGMINQGRDAPVYTPPVIILYIAPSDDVSEFYKTFYTVLNNPVVCNGQSYLPSVVCCSWGAPEISWTQKNPFPPSGPVDNDPNPAGIAEINEINDLFADATKRGINICVASGDRTRPNVDTNNSSDIDQGDIVDPPTIMFPASSPYVTCVGGSSVFFPNGPTRNYNNAGEFAWVRGDGGVSTAFPIPDYQSDIAGSALVSSDAFLKSSQATSDLLEVALGEANVVINDEGITQNVSLVAIKKKAALDNAQAAYDSAVTALSLANAAARGDAATLQLQLAVNAANTALAAAKAGSDAAQVALAAAQDAFIKATELDVILVEASHAYNVATVQMLADVTGTQEETILDEIASDAALLVANIAVAQGASSIIAPLLATELVPSVTALLTDANLMSNDLVVPYDSFLVSKVSPPNLINLYNGSSSSYSAKVNLDNVIIDLIIIQADVSMDSSDNVYTYCNDKQSVNELSTQNSANGKSSEVIAVAAVAARLVTTFNENVILVDAAKSDWSVAYANQVTATTTLNAVLAKVPFSTPKEISDARDQLSMVNQALTDASVKLADAEYAGLAKIITTNAVTLQLDGLSSDPLYTAEFDSSNNDALNSLHAAQYDASGANFDSGVAQTDMGSYVITSLNGLATVATFTAVEAMQRYNDWVSAAGASGTTDVVKDTRVTASEKAIAAATRVAYATKALQVVLDNAKLNAAVSTWVTNGLNATARTAVNTAVTAANLVVTTMYAALNTNCDASVAPVNTSILAAYNNIDGVVKSAVDAVAAAVTALTVPSLLTLTTNSSSLVTNALNAKLSVLNAEGSLLYATQTYSNNITRYDADYVAAVSTKFTIYDNFIAYNIAVNKASNLADLALKAANLANCRISASVTAAAKNKALFDAQNAAYALYDASVYLNKLVVVSSLITPSLVDSALRSNEANYNSAVASNVATAAADPTPVTPQMIDTLQSLVLKAKAQAQLTLEDQPTNAGRMTILANWNDAVLKGAAALDAIDETASSSTLQGIFTAYSDSIENAANTGAYYSSSNNIPNSSNLTLAAIAAYEFSTTYFIPATVNGNARYLMNVANTTIHVAENAAEVANASVTTADRVAAQALWNDASSRIEAIVGSSGSFPTGTLQVPSALYTSVAAAYKKTTGLSVQGNVTGSISGSTLTVTSIGYGTLASGSVLTYFDSSNNSATVTIGPDASGNVQLTNTGTGAGAGLGLMGTYNITTSLALSSRVFTTENATPSPFSDTDPTTQAYITAVAAYKSLKLAYDSYNINFLERLNITSAAAALAKATAQAAIKIALAAAARTQAAAKVSAQKATIMATASNPSSIQDDAALNATEAAFAASDNVNMYRCVPDIAMHADADDLPVIYRLNGGNVYVGGTSVAAAMFAGFLGVTQSHSPINYFINPVLYNNFSYPSPLFYDISGTSELLNPTIVTSRYNWIISDNLSDLQYSDPIHGSYNRHVGLGSIRADALSAFLEAPALVMDIRCGPYPVTSTFNYVSLPVATQSATVRPGTTEDIYVFVRPTSAYNTNVEWSCSSPYNATVSQTLETYNNVEVDTGVFATVYRARVTGVVPVSPLSPLPVITIKTTDGSNMFTALNVNVLSAIQVTGVSISSLGETKNPANTVLYLGHTLQLIATVTPVTATNKNVYWWSSNTSVVNVDVNGLITSLSPGQATIRVTTVNNNISASISVYVPTPMTGISVMPSMVTLNPNLLVYPLKNTQLIKALVTPENVDYKNLKWQIVSTLPHALPTGTTDSNGTAILYKDTNDASAVIVASIHQPNGTVLKRDSNGNITDNTQDTVTALSNGRIVIRVSTDGVTDTVYGTYSADVIVNVVTPVTDVKLEQLNMVIALNPSVMVPTGPTGVYALTGMANPLVSTFKAVNESVDVQFAAIDPDTTLPWFNAEVDDRNLDQSYNVTATLFPAYPSNMNLIWTSSNPKVAIVSNNTAPVLNSIGSDPNNGLFQITERITPLSNGSAVIKVTTADGNKVATVNVTVTTPVTSIVLSPMPVTLNPGKQYALQATVLPTTATITDLAWQSTNTAVARVDQSGVVTAVSSGSCGISVTTADGDYTAMATINVVTPLVGVSLVLNSPSPIRIGDMVQILVVMTPTTASDQAFTWTVTNGVNGNIFTNGPAQNGNIVYLDAAQAGSSVFTVTTHDGNKQANLALTVAPY
jgi:uncharacterized protein YjdB